MLGSADDVAAGAGIASRGAGATGRSHQRV